MNLKPTIRARDMAPMSVYCFCYSPSRRKMTVPAWLTSWQLVQHQRQPKSLRPLCLTLCTGNHATTGPVSLLHGDLEGSNSRYPLATPSTSRTSYCLPYHGIGMNAQDPNTLLNIP